jgi:hypothetical protein
MATDTRLNKGKGKGKGKSDPVLVKSKSSPVLLRPPVLGTPHFLTSTTVLDPSQFDGKRQAPRLTKVESDPRIIKNLEKVKELNHSCKRAADLVAKSKIAAKIEEGSLKLTMKLFEVSHEEKTRKALTVAMEKAMKKAMIAKKEHDEAVKQAFSAHEKYQNAIRAVTKLAIDSRKKSQQITHL